MQLVAEGKRYLNDCKLMSAVEVLSQAIKLDTSNSQAYYYRGCALNQGYASDGMDTITKDFIKCISLNPNGNFPEAYFYLAYFIHYGNSTLRLSYFNKAIQFNPTEYRYFRERGSVKERLGMFEDALIDYAKAIKLNPKDDISYRYKSVIERRIGRIKDALYDFEMEARISGNWDYWMYATYLCEAGKIKEAKVALEKFNSIGQYAKRSFEQINCKGISGKK
jgi:tetratricopeptide (TPR) repeat protein